MLGSCSRRDDVDRMLRQGHWPDGCDEELCVHIDGCGTCREWILLTRSFQQARLGAMDQARPGASFLLWWKAELRRRDAALSRASRPMLLAQIVALVTGVVAMPVFLAVVWSQVRSWVTPADGWRAVSELHTNLASLPAWFGLGSSLMVPALGLLAVGLLGGVVVYLASDAR